MADTTTDHKVRVGLIGCGGISNAHLAGLSKFEDVELAAFCDIIPERAHKHVAKYGGVAYDDAAKMLNGTKLDAAYVLIPTYAHGAPERACIAAGVPFLVEKPVGLHPEELRSILADVQNAGLITAAGFMTRYRKSVQRVRELVKQDEPILIDGAWVGGPPLRKEGDYFASAPIGQWWPIKSKSGGQFVEQVIHTVDLARYLVGEVSEVFAYAARDFNQRRPNIIQNYDLDDAMVVSMKFKNGAVGNIMACCANGARGGVFLNLWSAKHTAYFTDWAHHVKIYREGESGAEEIAGESEIFPIEDRAFIDAIKSGKPDGILADYGEGVRSTILALAANQSLETHEAVAVEL